jgi:membrane protein
MAHRCGTQTVASRYFQCFFHRHVSRVITPRHMWKLTKTAVDGWLEDRAASMGAALAYYTAFSIAPLLVIAISVAGLVFGRETAQAAVVNQLQGLLGSSGGAAVTSLLMGTAGFGTHIMGIIIGVSALIVTATTAFVELQDDLDRIWKAPPRLGSGVFNLIRSRLLSLAMVVFMGFLLAVSLILSAAVSALGTYTFAGIEVALQAGTFVISFAVITALFAMIYKLLPNVAIAWKEVWIGAAVTALLFDLGKEVIGLYIGKSDVATSFGAAGPCVVFMVWLYYSTQILQLGAEFTYAYASDHRQVGSAPDASPMAVLTVTGNASEGGAPGTPSDSLPPGAHSSPPVRSPITPRRDGQRVAVSAQDTPLATSVAGLLTGALLAKLLFKRPSTRRSPRWLV